MTQASSSPGARAAWVLGLSGLLPFFAGGAVVWAGAGRVGGLAFAAPFLLLAYGATISSFLGGVRWGVEVARAEGPGVRRLALSVTPQLAAWALAAVPGLPLDARFGGLALLLLVQGIADASARDLPDWFRALRIPLTVGAVVALAAAAVWAARLPALPHG